MAAVDVIVASMIQQAQSVANTAVTQALQYTDLAANQIAVGGNAAGVSVSYGKVGAPANPYTSDASVTAAFDSAFTQFSDTFKSNISFILGTYFPLFETVGTNSDGWINTTLTSPNTGLPAPVEAALFSRGQDRLLTESLRTEDEALSLWSGRGFSLPPGVLVSKLQQSQQDAASRIGDLSRDVLVENTRITVESVRMAAQLSVQLRVGITDALGRLLGVAAETNTASIEYARTLDTAMYHVAELIVQYYGATVREAELAMTAQARLADTEVQQLGHLVNLDAAVLGTNAQRILGAANATGALAAAAMASQITHGSLSSSQSN